MTVEDWIAKIKAHDACQAFEEKPQCYLVQFPDGYFPAGMISIGKTERSLVDLYSQIDAFWRRQRLKLPKRPDTPSQPQ